MTHHFLLIKSFLQLRRENFPVAGNQVTILYYSCPGSFETGLSNFLEVVCQILRLIAPSRLLQSDPQLAPWAERVLTLEGRWFYFGVLPISSSFQSQPRVLLEGGAASRGKLWAPSRSLQSAVAET